MGHVIKAHGHVVPAAVMDARAEANELVSTARRKADLIRAATDVERERVLKEAHDEGYERGRARAAAETIGVLAAARAEASAVLARARPEALAVAAAMAERIVGRAVALEPAVMAEIAGEALAACQTRRGGVTLRVHPEHVAQVERHRTALATRLGGDAALEIVPDEAVEPLGCVVDTAVGRVDARLPTLLAALMASLAQDEGDAGR